MRGRASAHTAPLRVCFCFAHSAAGLGAVRPYAGERRGKPLAADWAGTGCPPPPCSARARLAPARCAVQPRAWGLRSSLPQPGLPTTGCWPQRNQAPDMQRAGCPGLRPAPTSLAPHFLRENNKVCAPLEPASERTLPAGLGALWAHRRQWRARPKLELWTWGEERERRDEGGGSAPQTPPLPSGATRAAAQGGSLRQARGSGFRRCTGGARYPPQGSWRPRSRQEGCPAPGAALRLLALQGREYPSPFSSLRKQRPRFTVRRPSHPRPACAAGSSLTAAECLGPRAGLPSPRPAACAALQGTRGAEWGAAVWFWRDRRASGAPRARGDGGPSSRSPGAGRPGALRRRPVPTALGSGVCAPDAPHPLGRRSSGCLRTSVRGPVFRLVNFLVFGHASLCAPPPAHPATATPAPTRLPSSCGPGRRPLGNAPPGTVRWRPAEERSGEVRACHLLVSVETSCKRGRRRRPPQAAPRGKESALFRRDLYSFRIYLSDICQVPGLLWESHLNVADPPPAQREGLSNKQ